MALLKRIPYCSSAFACNGFIVFLIGSILIFYKLNYFDTHKCLEQRLAGPLMGDDPLLVEYLKANYLTPPSPLPYNLTGLTPKTRGHHLYLSKNILHMFVMKQFANSSPGFFVEAGALDGETTSNTLWLETKRNWSGLLVEPYSVNCDAMLEKRRKAWVSCSCITPKTFAESTVMEIPFQKNEEESKILLYRANVRSVNSRFHVFEDMIKKTSRFSYKKVQCFPLATYLLALNIKQVDLLSLDTQGGEKGIIESLPLHKIQVNYMIVEYFRKGINPTFIDPSFVNLMQEKNYYLVEFSNKTGEYIFALKKT